MLASFYSNRERYDEAASLYKRIIAIHEKIKGTNHLDVAYTMDALARLYSEQGKYSEAETILDIIESLDGLAKLYFQQKKFSEVEVLCKRSITIHENVLGTNHPRLLRKLDKIAKLFRSMNLDQEALELEDKSKHKEGIVQ